MSLSPFDSFQSQFVTYLLNFPRISVCVKGTRYPERKYSHLRGLFSTALQHCDQRPHLSNLGMHFLSNAKVRIL